MFDLAAVYEAYGKDYVVAALQSCGLARCEASLSACGRMDSNLVKKVISSLMYRDANQHLIESAQSITEKLLELSISSWPADDRPQLDFPPRK
jgi:hypothetical protein